MVGCITNYYQPRSDPDWVGQELMSWLRLQCDSWLHGVYLHCLSHWANSAPLLLQDQQLPHCVLIRDHDALLLSLWYHHLYLPQRGLRGEEQRGGACRWQVICMDIDDSVMDVFTRSFLISFSWSHSPPLLPLSSSSSPLLPNLYRLLLSFLLREQGLPGSASDRLRVGGAREGDLSHAAVCLYPCGGCCVCLLLSSSLRPVLSLVPQQTLPRCVGGAAVAAERLLRHVRGPNVSPQLGGQSVAWGKKKKIISKNVETNHSRNINLYFLENIKKKFALHLNYLMKNEHMKSLLILQNQWTCKTYFFLLICCLSRQLCCKLFSVVAVSYRGVCLLSSLMELHWSRSERQKQTFEKLKNKLKSCVSWHNNYT